MAMDSWRRKMFRIRFQEVLNMISYMKKINLDCQTFTSPFCHFFIVLFTMKLLLGPDKTERCPVFRISMVSKSYWLKGVIIWWISSLILIWTLLTTTSNDFFQALKLFENYTQISILNYFEFMKFIFPLKEHVLNN